jgi:hypothetical protein
MSLVTVIGRGHSGTRMISHTLYASGVFMGELLNRSGDLVPPDDMYEACRVFARYVTWEGDLNWNWDAAFEAEIPQQFTDLIQAYLKSVLESSAPHRGWKIPETTLVYPWILRMFPEAKYIFWARNPRDCILGKHVTDDLRRFGIEYPALPEQKDENGNVRYDERLRRAISWKYQYDLMQTAPKPDNWIEMRFEDFVLNRDHELARLEEFLGIELARIPVRQDAVARWKRDEGVNYYDFLAPAMAQHGYEIPAKDEVELLRSA